MGALARVCVRAQRLRAAPAARALLHLRHYRRQPRRHPSRRAPINRRRGRRAWLGGGVCGRRGGRVRERAVSGLPARPRRARGRARAGTWVSGWVRVCA